jgi:hypothetical protein
LLTSELVKSLEPLPLPPLNVYGNGTVEVSWFTYRSTVPLPFAESAIPSGIDSNM